VKRLVAVDVCDTLARVNEAIAACLGLGSGWRWTTHDLRPAGVAGPESWFRRHPEVFAEAVPLPGAQEALDAAASAGREIAYVTARSDWARLRRWGFPRGELVLAVRKAPACAALGASLAVEDAPDQVRDLRRVVPVRVIGHPYNGSRLTWRDVGAALCGRRGKFERAP
jgi:hypothetical protein